MRKEKMKIGYSHCPFCGKQTTHIKPKKEDTHNETT